MDAGRFTSRLLILIALISVYKTSSAEQWVDLRLGTADSDPTISVHGVYSTSGSLYSATYRFGSHLLDRSYYRELSVGVGRHYTNWLGATTLQAGIGLFELEDKDQDSKVELTLPLSATFILGKYVGFSSTAYLNINRIEPLIGIEFGVALGQFN